MSKGDETDIIVTSRTKFASPTTITFTEGQKEVSVPELLKELKKLGMDVSITDAQIQELQHAAPGVLEWLASDKANLKKFARNPETALKKVLPDLLIPKGVERKEFKANYSVSFPELDARVQDMLRDVVTWAGSSTGNMRKLARNPEKAIAAIAKEQPEAVVKAAVEALGQLRVSSYETVLQALGSAHTAQQRKAGP